MHCHTANFVASSPTYTDNQERESSVVNPAEATNHHLL